MCLARTTPKQESAMDRSKFLRTAQSKRSINKKKAEPNMRIEALLEATCKRLRQEMKFERKRISEETWYANKKQRYDCISDDDSNSSDSDVDLDDYDGDGNDEDQPSMCTVHIKRFSDQAFAWADNDFNSGSCASGHNAGPDSRLERRPLCLWDDPQQVEDFFRQVDTVHDSDKNFCDNLELDKELFNPLQTDPERLLATCVPSCDLNSFTSEFDSLYHEMFQKLSAVENMVTLQQNGYVVTVLDGS